MYAKSNMETYIQFSSIAELCPTLCDPIDGSPPGSPIPGILQARTLEWVAKTLGIKPPYDPEIPLLGKYPEETKI